MKTNEFNLQVGDIIMFTNERNYKYHLYVRRITEKSYWVSFRVEEMKGHRESWNTLKSYKNKYPDFQIIKNPAL